MALVRRFSRLIDRDLRFRPYGGATNLVLLPALVPIFTIRWISSPYGWRDILVLIVVGALSALWFGFVGWRMWRGLRAISLRGDREYDRHTRPILSRGYRDSDPAGR